MKAIILAAGRGSRMGNLTENKPKCLLKIKGFSLLERQMKALKEAGIKDISIVTGYKKKMLSIYKLKEFHNSRWNHTQMFYSLTKAKSWLNRFTCIISYSDIFYDFDIVKQLINEKEELAIAYDEKWLSLWSKRFKKPLDDAESFKKSDKGYLTEIGKKVDDLNSIEGQYMGLIKTTPSGWQKLENIYKSLDNEVQENIHFTNILNIGVERHSDFIKVIPVKSKWGEVDTKNDLDLYNKMIN